MLRFTQQEIDELAIQKIRHEIQSDTSNLVDPEKLSAFLYKQLQEMKPNITIQNLGRDEKGHFTKI
jgi:hypothetical protein